MTLIIPTLEPARFNAGDTLKWTKSLSDYKPEDSWVLSYSLLNETGNISITASDNGDSKHLVNVAAATTAVYPPGVYSWQSFVTMGSDRYSIEQGTMEIGVDYAVQSAVDTRTHARRMLDAIEVRLQMRAPDDIESYSAESMSVSRLSPEQAQAQWGFWKARVREEEALKALKQGRANQFKVHRTMRGSRC